MGPSTIYSFNKNKNKLGKVLENKNGLDFIYFYLFKIIYAR